MKYTIESAVEAGTRGDLETWVHEFLMAEGGNRDLAAGLKLVPRTFLGPIEMSLDLFRRCCGPEADMKYPVPREGFEERVQRLVGAIEDRQSLPPLILNYSNSELTLNDGNHRYEALTRAGVEKFPVILWTTGEADMKDFEEEYSNKFKKVV